MESRDEGDVWASSPVIAHIDMDAFYASVEMLDNPEFRGKPVIVGGDMKRGVVSAANYEARNFGVHSAMPLFKAKKLCPNGIFIRGRMDRYGEISRAAMKCLGEFSPLVEQVSVDEAYVDLTGTRQIFGDPEEAARGIKRRMKEKTSLTCSIGVSVSKLLAKIASDVNKPDGLTIIAPHEVRDFLSKLPVGKVPGVGAKLEEELARIGIRCVGDIRKYSPDFLAGHFGKLGMWLTEIADGGEDSSVVPYSPPKSVSAEDTLAEDTDDRMVITRCILEQAERVGRRLREEGFRGRTVTLKIKHHDFRQVTRSETLEEPTQLGEAIYREALKLLGAYELHSKVRLIGVGVSNLEPARSPAQMSLFRDSKSPLARWENVERAADEIVRRFGDGAVKRGRLLDERKRAD